MSNYALLKNKCNSIQISSHSFFQEKVPRYLPVVIADNLFHWGEGDNQEE